MFKQVIIITDDSGTILPTRNIWKSTFGTGIDIRKHDHILQILGKNGLKIPTNDLDNEKKYQELLYEYIRPAKFMYAGMFSEVRSFVDELGKRCDVDLYIISGRYGLINQNDEIIPHKYHINTIERLEGLDDALDFSTKIQELCIDRSMLILCLPKHYISYLNSIRWFEEIPEDTNIVMITSNEFSYLESQQGNIRVLPRKGVCRLGKENKKEIQDLILRDLNSIDQTSG
ncbi:hypothetical protein J2129_000869 [Methanofollis sp. W23]|uniref:hypothetical protein n=1 Tax=Methanofollis sp. W23 TaxID=2817849 RepID=UPI001AE1816C|nr:hypothetical protein [Methanofollis sp. W23]MBP2145415.1 hypothetical protein [Methanofollis sp. W23]